MSYDYSYVEDYYNGKVLLDLSAPFTATYDTRNDTLNPTSGFYLRLLAEPDYVTDEPAMYLTGDSELRLYRALDDDERFVLAARGARGEHRAVPISRTCRLTAASMRAAAARCAATNIWRSARAFRAMARRAGLSRVDGSLEARIKVTDTIGIVPFVDGGYVAETSLFGGDEEFRWSVGLGLRYYTAVGPDQARCRDPHQSPSGRSGFRDLLRHRAELLMTRILALILLLLTALPAQAQEQSASGFVERLLESVLSAEGRSLSIQNTSISLTGDVTVGRVEVRDGEDAWLVIENLSLVWRPLSLFGKQLEVTSLTAARVHMLRMPRTPEGKRRCPAGTART